ncbi:MAG TPA: TonB-dependent receptor [Blastocatellia bacterium]|nr:TonB-dependent receptor [Blastocatellia bacterium]
MHRNRTPLLLLTLLLVLGSFALDAKAQAVYGSISGVVTDPTGAVVPGATVTITSVERGDSDTVTTNDSGLYVKERLLPGTYEVKVEAQGFRPQLVTKVAVNLDAQTKVDAILEPGAVGDTVTVTAAEGQLLKTDRADVATTFEERQITDLPILDRNFTKFILLTPGTQQLQWQHAASENPQGSTQIMVNGQHFSGTGYQLDGTENRDPILGIIVINPNFEAIGESKVTSQNYDAEFGQAIAGIVSVQTKSGTNDLHGAVFVFRQNDEWQARNPFTQFQPDPISGRLIPPTLKTQFGGAIGGPILRDRLFFFGDYQGTRSKIGGSRLLTVPTLAARSGDLSAYGVDIFDPLTGQQFPGNRIPNGRLSPQALALLNLIPLPNAAGTENGTRNNFVASGSEIFDNDTFDVRIDNRVSGNFNLFGRYSFADYTRNGPQAFGAGGGRQLVSLGGLSKVRNHSLALGFDYTLSSTMLVDFRFGFFKYGVNVLPNDFGTRPAADAGIPGLNLDDTFTSGLFAAFISDNIDRPSAFRFGSGLDEFTGRCNCPLDQQEKQYQFVTNLLKTWGNHTMKFGVDVRRAFNLRVPSDNHRSGELTFSQRRTGRVVNGVLQDEGLGLATFLIGDVTSFVRMVSTSTDARERQWRHFYYGQDTWRATQKFTLAFGLRLDVINPQSVNEPGNGGWVDPDTGEVIVGGVGGNSLNGGVENSLNWAPRLGIAYQLNDKTVVRAGYGRSYDLGVFGSVFGHTVTQNLPVLAIQNLTSPSEFGSVFNLQEGPPPFTAFFGLDAPPNQGGQPNASLPANGRFFLPDGVRPRIVNFKQRLPTVDAWNVTVQHQLTDTISLEAAYVGNKGTRVFCGNNPDCEGNQPTLEGFGTVPRNNRRPFFNKFGWTQDVLLYCNCGDNRYNSLQTKFTKRFDNSYSVLAHYTWQRSTNYDRDYFFIDRSINHGPSDFDRTHVFVLSQLAELPIGRNRRFLGNIPRSVDYLIGGWQFNSNTTIQSGLPFNVGFDTSGISDTGPNRPDIIGDPNTGGSRERFFDPTVFAKPAVGTFGNLRRNALRGPNYWRTDASLFKKLRFTENKELEFRVEVVNLFNHVNLDQPDSFIGDPANPSPNAGRITNTAFGGADPQRNFQFALRFKF